MTHWRPYLLGALALAAALAAAVYLGRPDEVVARPEPVPSTGRAGAAPVVLVTIDTLRADHLGLGGHFADTSPRLDAFAEQATVFTHAWSASGTTTPSHLSLLTGLYPHQHGVLGNRDVERSPFRSADGMRTVAEALAADGYTTAGFVSAAPVKRQTGLATGFAVWEEPNKPSWPCDRTAAHAVSWLQRNDNDRFFLWVHLWEPHTPNHPDDDLLERFAGDARYEALLDARHVDADDVRRHTSDGLLKRFMPPGESPRVDRAMLTGLLARYDADIRRVDTCLAGVFDAVREGGWWDAALIAVTADHGQSLGQHRWLGHNSARAPVLRVPLIVKLPRALSAPGRVDAVASGVDVLPTLMARLDTPGAGSLVAQASGRDLLSGTGVPGEALALGGSDGASHEWSLVAGAWKLHRRPDGVATLYDLDRDPLELHDVSGRHPDVARRLAKRLDALLSERPRANQPESDADADLARELEALGYAE